MKHIGLGSHRPRRSRLRRPGAALLVAALAGALLAVPAQVPAASASQARAQVARAADRLDEITFGDTTSEQTHAFSGESTAAVDGSNGQKARVSRPLTPPGYNLGDLTFTVQVDPKLQNYLSVKFWGGDDSTYKSVVMINGEYVSYRANGDHEPINVGTRGNALPGRFFFSTAMLPLASTKGRTEARITLRTYHPTLTTKSTEESRRFYQAFTHTTAKVTSVDDTGYRPSTQAAAKLTAAEEQAKVAAYRARQIADVLALEARVDANPAATMSIVRYQDELRFYAESLLMDWSPTTDKRKGLERIFASIDNFTRQYYGDVKSLGNGGHQSDWGGYYGALGEALYIVENLITPIYGRTDFERFLHEPFQTGTQDGPNSIAGADWSGGELTRGEAWERVLKANFDFARSRLSYIYNQMMYTYEGAWKAHEGLRVIGSKFYEGKDRSNKIVGESLGWEPFLGEEVLVGPGGKDLDLYHSLFHHDQTAQYTDDYLQIVMKGLARSKLDRKGKVVRRTPYGEHYTGITKDGLTRENGYVGNYGESTNYLPTWFYRTLGHKGDERLNDEILKLSLHNVYARGQTRYQGTDTGGNRIMTMQQVVDWRNSAFPGKTAYSTEVGTPQAFAYTGLEKYMADNPDRYRGKQWEPYWEYARAAVGFMQQQLADNQFFPYFDTVVSKHKYDLRLTEEYAYVTAARAGYERFGKAAAGVLLPHTDLARYTDAELAALGVDRAAFDTESAWTDIDNLLVTVRDGDTHLYAALNERNIGYTGAGRVHVQAPGYEHLAEVQTQGRLDSRGYYLRGSNSAQQILAHDWTAPAGTPPLAWTGDLMPVAYQPGVGTVVRDNYAEDTPYSGYPNLITSRYGRYFMAVNTTRGEFGNKQSFTVPLPAGNWGGEVVDLVSGKPVKIKKNAVSVGPESAVVLRLGGDATGQEVPAAVDVAVATPGTREVGLSWRPAAGAESYTISRSTREDGPYVKVAEVTATSHVDEAPGEGTYYYKVAAGAGQPSNPVRARVTAPHTRELARTGWRDDLVGASAGKAAVHGTEITLSGVNGKGFGTGDDSVIYRRFAADSYAMVSKLVAGSAEVRAEVRAGVGGVILRDSADPVGRYVWLGLDADGKLAMRTRTLDTRADAGMGLAGNSNSGGVTRSPFTVARSEPLRHLKLVRAAGSQQVTGYASADGRTWASVGTLVVPMTEVIHAGVSAATDATFAGVAVERRDRDVVTATAARGERGSVRVEWSKPDDAVAFDVYRTADAAVAATDPLTAPGWTKVVQGSPALVYDDQILAGELFYKVAALGSASDAVRVTAEGITAALERARAVKAEDYSQASFAAFDAELDAVEADPDGDEAARIKRVYDAYSLLVPVFKHGFEADEPDIWATGGSAPGGYQRVISQEGAHNGARGLFFASTDTTGNGAYNLWFNSRKAGGISPIAARPNTRYKVSFDYRLTDYVPGTTVGAYAFVRSFKGGTGVGTDQRNWLPAGDTPVGTWARFEREYTSVDGDIDNLELTFGLRGSSGSFQVDDVRVEPVG
ncbi:Tat pathway signal protein [Streptosporangium sp. 'caverna']|uniref:Tat pathway signal protein n=1 Tax=Streptosporangium sp. 'caverna' TaxID=2202249 RepID=UPI000D7EA9F2|nr:Tat pathway signal protein [Streptosporangium sp. 'caverna']AWS43597.1 Tat pathway signal protein [Streptosporangium sp. 'caverna']